MSSKRAIRVGALGIIGSLIGCNAGDDGLDAHHQTAEVPLSVDAAITQLKKDHPSAHVFVQGERIRRVYGAIATGDTPAAAAEAFRRQSAATFGVDIEDLAPTGSASSSTSFRRSAAAHANDVGLMYDRTTGTFRFRLFTYQQQRDGIPVFRAGLRTLVRAEGDPTVVWANTDLRPLGSFRAQASASAAAVDLDKSLRAVRTAGGPSPKAAPAPTSLTHVSAPTPTIFAGVGTETAAPRLAMQYTAQDAHGAGTWTFVADATTGDILHVESNVHFDIQGTVEAEVIAGSESMECGTLDLAPLPHAHVTSPAGNALTDATGAFTIVESGSGTVTVTSAVTGEYFAIDDHAGNPHTMSVTVAPPGPADFVHQDPDDPPERVLAQLNAYKGANEIRDMLLTYVPGYPVIAGETNLPVHVNRTDFTCEVTGGAWYDDAAAPRTINFCQRTGDRTNTAFGSIIHHEYGHHIIDSGGSGQSEYGEGMADAIAALFSGDPRIGVGYYPNNCSQPLRSIDNDCQYSATECSSCGPGLYECGAVLSSTIWDIWQELEISAPANADDIIRSLVFSSIPLHTGSDVDASIAIDMLTLDDDDGLLENGTPHYVEICAGFAAHGMSCPDIVDGLVVQGADLDSEGPSDGPFEPVSVSYTLHNLGPDEILTYAVTIPPEASWLTVDSSSGTVPLGETATVTVSIDQTQAATLPDGDYSTIIQFVNQSSGTGTVGREAQLRVGALVPIYTATFEDGLDGYIVDSEYGNLWHATTACADELPGHSSPGSLYYGRDDLCNYLTSVPIRHTATSPVIEIDNPATVELGFNYLLRTENDSNYDSASVLIAVDGGPFQVVASNNEGGETLNETNGWEPFQFDISDLLPNVGPTSIQVQLAFNAGDPENNIRTGFVIDDITVHARPAAPQGCTSDAQCDDGLFCNGIETCVDLVCAAGTPIPCDDGIACTSDSCDEATSACVSTPLDTSCDDGIACNGTETCDPTLDCQPGEPLVCDDGNDCTTDFCDDIVGCTVEHTTGPCDDDGDTCTDDVCGDGVCTHPDNGTCESGGPCASYCTNPVTYNTSHFQSGNLGTGATCHETTAPLAGGVCGNFVSPRQLYVNGVPMTCNWNLWSLPPAQNGGYCIHTTSGGHPWAGFSTWTW